MSATPSGPPGGGVVFLLAQLGAHATTRFAERLQLHDLTPPQAGILRLVRQNEGLSQQALAGLLGVLPSRVVALVDELEDRGLVQRSRSAGDRRTNVLELTAAGTSALRTLASVGKAHEAEICTGLSEKEHMQLAALLGRLAVSAGLTPGVHPGYRGIA